MSDISKKQISTLRKMAVEAGIEGAEEMERKELIEALEALNSAEKSDESDESEESSNEEESDANEDESEAEEEVPPAPADLGAPKNVEGSADVFNAAAPAGSKAEAMKLKLMAQPKVRIFVPLEGKEKLGVTISVILNGYRLNVPKGVYIDVPEQVAEVIADSLNQSSVIANHPLRMDGNRPELE